jgi:hypothetical protein
MNVETAQIVVNAFYGYVAAGILFAAWFVARGAARIDAKAGAGTVGFRMLVFPGAVALWPVLVVKILRRGST